MLKTFLHKILANNFIRDCVLFGGDIPLHWFIGVMVWGSFIMFIYAGLGLIRLGL